MCVCEYVCVSSSVCTHGLSELETLNMLAKTTRNAYIHVHVYDVYAYLCTILLSKHLCVASDSTNTYTSSIIHIIYC